MELTEYRCRRCGGELAQQNETQWKCSHCGSSYYEESVKEDAKKLQDFFNEAEQKTIRNLRRNLYDATTEEFIDNGLVFHYCRELKKYLPEDFRANFYEIAVGDDLSKLVKAIKQINVEANRDEIDTVITFLIKSFQQSRNYLLALNGLVERAYKNTDLQKYREYATAVEIEVDKADKGVYDTRLPRDVFIAYSSADIEHVEKLTEELEQRQGLKCFVALRNLRHGKGAANNYDKALAEAMDHCRVFVFVSTPNSRSVNCDAYSKELEYIRNKDIENAPSRYKYDYRSIPVEFKKPRVQYMLKQSETYRAADDFVNEFFDSFEWAYTVEDVAHRVLYQMKSTKHREKKKYCAKCGTEMDESTKCCPECHGFDFVDTLEEYNSIKIAREQEELRIRAEEERRIREENERRERDKALLDALNQLKGGASLHQAAVSQPAVASAQSGNIASLLERAFMFLEDRNWKSAKEYAERFLDIEPKNGEAFLCKLMADMRVSHRRDLAKSEKDFDGHIDFNNIIKYGSDELKKEVQEYSQENKYNRATAMLNCDSKEGFTEAARLFYSISGYRDSNAKAKLASDLANNFEKEMVYRQASENMKSDDIAVLIDASKAFYSISGYKDADSMSKLCLNRIKEIKYNKAISKKNNKSIQQLTEAVAMFDSLKDYRDSSEQIISCKNMIFELKYIDAKRLMDSNKYQYHYCLEAAKMFDELGDYADSAEMASLARTEAKYRLGLEYMQSSCHITSSSSTSQIMSAKDVLGKAIEEFSQISDYKDSNEKEEECNSLLSQMETYERISRDREDAEWRAIFRKERNKKIKKALLIVSIVVIFATIAFAVIWQFLPVSNLYSPEIIGSYYGQYEPSNGREHNAVITIDSVDNDGNVKGVFSFNRDGYDVYGKYSFHGKITRRLRNGDMNISIYADEWIIEPSNYNMLDLEIKIKFGSTKLICSEIDMTLEKTTVLESITINADKNSARVGDSVKLSFTANPSNPSVAQEAKEYDRLCIEYWVIINKGEAVQLSSREAVHTYVFEEKGIYEFYVVYCPHTNCSKNNDMKSETIRFNVVE